MGLLRIGMILLLMYAHTSVCTETDKDSVDDTAAVKPDHNCNATSSKSNDWEQTHSDRAKIDITSMTFSSWPEWSGVGIGLTAHGQYSGIDAREDYPLGTLPAGHSIECSAEWNCQGKTNAKQTGECYTGVSVVAKEVTYFPSKLTLHHPCAGQTWQTSMESCAAKGKCVVRNENDVDQSDTFKFKVFIPVKSMHDPDYMGRVIVTWINIAVIAAWTIIPTFLYLYNTEWTHDVRPSSDHRKCIAERKQGTEEGKPLKCTPDHDTLEHLMDIDHPAETRPSESSGPISTEDSPVSEVDLSTSYESENSSEVSADLTQANDKTTEQRLVAQIYKIEPVCRHGLPAKWLQNIACRRVRPSKSIDPEIRQRAIPALMDQFHDLCSQDRGKEDYGNLLELEKGTYGRIYKGERRDECKNNSKVVVKMSELRDSNFIDILQELQAKSTSNHPNLVRFIECFVVSDPLQTWIVTEYVKGQTLSDINRYCPLREEQIPTVLDGCLKGLDFLHYNAITHGNMTSRTTLVTDSGRVKLADFGTLPRVLALRREGKLSDNSAPELLNGNPGNDKVDIWMLGLMIIGMLQGSATRMTDCDTEALMGMKPGNIPTGKYNGMTGKILRLIEECLEEDPAQRPAVLILRYSQFYLFMLRDEVTTLIETVAEANHKKLEERKDGQQ